MTTTVSIVDPSVENLGSVQYLISFSQPTLINGAADFQLVATGSVSGANIAQITDVSGGNSTEYIVTVGTGTGTGSLDLIYNPGGTGPTPGPVLTITSPGESLSNDTGVSSSDQITRDPSLSGIAQPYEQLTIRDGTTILGTTVANGSGNWSFTPQNLADGQHTLTVTGGLTVASTATDGTLIDADLLSPRFSPDGANVAFISSSTIYEKNLATGAIAPIGSTNGVDFSFSPDGHKVVFDNNIEDLTTGTLTQLPIPADATNPIFSPDGSKIGYVSSVSGVPELYVLDLTSNTVTLATADQNGNAAVDASGNAAVFTIGRGIGIFSPDSQKIAFESDAVNLVPGHNDGSVQLYIKDLATGAVTWVAKVADFTPGNQYSFSPDGTQIAYESDAHQINIMNFTTGAVTVIPQGFNQPMFSPDGSEIAFSNNNAVFIENLATGTIAQISPSGGGVIGAQYPVFSPDGSKVAFWMFSQDSNGNGTLEVVVRDLHEVATSSSLNVELATNPPVVTITSMGGPTSQANQTVNGTVVPTTGEAVAGTTVVLFDNGNQVGSAVADSNGNWSANVTLAQGANNLFAEATDLAGNIGDSGIITYTVTGNAVSGVGFDGYISGATVFADANDNGVLDSLEVSTTTNANGQFVLQGGMGPLVLIGGTDITTGKPFTGSLSAPAGSTTISPLTTLINDLSPLSTSAAEQKVLNALGLSSSLDLTTLDPIAAGKAGDLVGAAAEVAGAKVYDTVSLIAATMSGAGHDFTGATTDAFSAIAAAINGSGVNLTDTVSVSTLISNVAAAEHITLGQGVADAVAAIIVAGNQLLDQKQQADTSGTSLLADVAAVELTLQGAASDLIQAAAGDTTKLAAADSAFTGAGLQAVVAAAADHLSHPGQNEPPVAQNDFGFSTESNVGLTIAASALLGNDIDVDAHDQLSIQSVQGAQNGVVSLGANGAVTFTPTTGYSGPAGFTYTISDGHGGTATASVGVTITPHLITGTTANNTITGTAASDRIDGLGGNDTINGGDGNDILIGSAGNDVVHGGNGNDTFIATLNDGNDTYIGDAGVDTYDASLITVAVTIDLRAGTAKGSQIGSDTLSSIENVIGASGGDTLAGDDNANRLDGGPGNDILTGRGGTDTFVFKSGFGKDLITDFAVAGAQHDVIEFSTSMFADWNALQSHITDSANGAVITLDTNDTITLTGVTKAQLVTNHVDDFRFV